MLHADLKASCEHVKIKPLLMIQAVSIRWNTTAELIGQAKDLCPTLNLLINREQNNKSHGVQLKHSQLLQQEWDLGIRCFLRQQRRCLKARFHFYMKSFHCSISSCITLTSTLRTWRTSLQFVPLLDEAMKWWISIMDSQTSLLYITLQWVSPCFSQNLKVDMFHQCCIQASSIHTLAKPNGHRNGSPLQRRYWRMSGQIIPR